MPAGGGNQPATPAAAINYGWEKFKANWGEIIVALLIGFAVIVVLQIIGFVIFRAITVDDSGTCNISTTPSVQLFT